MGNEDELQQVDPGTGMTLEQLIDAFVSGPRERKRIKTFILSINDNQEAE